MQKEEKKYQDDKFYVMAKKLRAAIKKAAQHFGENAHVILRDGKWAVLKEGFSRVSGTYDTKASAIIAAKRFKNAGDVKAIIVHQKDGTIEKWL